MIHEVKMYPLHELQFKIEFNTILRWAAQDLYDPLV